MVLVADDERGIRRALSRVLKYYGFTVIEAEDGQHAVDTFTEHADEIAAVILDVTMPGMNGIDAFRAIRRIRPHAPVLLSSGYTEQDILMQLADENLTGFVEKPFDEASLVRTLRSLMGRPEA